MLRRPSSKRNAVGAGYYDNIYSASVVLLMVAALESFSSRLRYFKGVPTPKANMTVAQYIKHVFRDFRLSKAVTEVFVLRDALFHNHLWVLQSSWRPTRLHSATLVSHREDRKYRSAVNSKTRRTRTLRLHIVPTQVDRRDALKVIDTVWKALLFIEGKDRRYCYVSDHNVAFQGQMQSFTNVRNALANAL
jgi:hypothetical protein